MALDRNNDRVQVFNQQYRVEVTTTATTNKGVTTAVAHNEGLTGASVRVVFKFAPLFRVHLVFSSPVSGVPTNIARPTAGNGKQ